MDREDKSQKSVGAGFVKYSVGNEMCGLNPPVQKSQEKMDKGDREDREDRTITDRLSNIWERHKEKYSDRINILDLENIENPTLTLPVHGEGTRNFPPPSPFLCRLGPCEAKPNAFALVSCLNPTYSR